MVQASMEMVEMLKMAQASKLAVCSMVGLVIHIFVIYMADDHKYMIADLNSVAMPQVMYGFIVNIVDIDNKWICVLVMITFINMDEICNGFQHTYKCFQFIHTQLVMYGSGIMDITNCGMWTQACSTHSNTAMPQVMYGFIVNVVNMDIDNKWICVLVMITFINMDEICNGFQHTYKCLLFIHTQLVMYGSGIMDITNCGMWTQACSTHSNTLHSYHHTQDMWIPRRFSSRVLVFEQETSFREQREGGPRGRRLTLATWSVCRPTP